MDHKIIVKNKGNPTLFEQDMWERGFKGEDKGGLVDRTSQKYYLFDVDGTKQAARQRSLTSKEEYPSGQRRSRKACAKGYTGRKRGQVRIRSTIAQAHTSEWLGTFGAPGNGSPEPELQRACLIIQKYLQQQNLPGNRAMVRLDGYYGVPKFVNQIQQHQLGYLLRSRDYGLLEHQSIRTRPVAKSRAIPEKPSITPVTQPKEPVLWLDFPTTQLRRELSYQLKKQQLIIEPINVTTPINQPSPQFLTRDQRAHRR